MNRVRVLVTTHYEALDADCIQHVEFTCAVEKGLAALQKYDAVNARDPQRDHFAVFLGFSAINDEITAVSAVLIFHAASTLTEAMPWDVEGGTDYILSHYTGHFYKGEEQATATRLASRVDEALTERLKQH